MNSPLVANSDLRIEYVTMYMNSYSGSTNSGPGSPNGGYYGYNSTTHGVYGNYNNLKIGRGINRINNYGREYFSAYGVAGGNANGSNNLIGLKLVPNILIISVNNPIYFNIPNNIRLNIIINIKTFFFSFLSVFLAIYLPPINIDILLAKIANIPNFEEI